MKRKVLFVAEALTLAQVVRLLVLARGIDREKYDVHFACRDFPALLFADVDFECSPLYTIEPETGLCRVERGDRIYDATILTRYVESERELISRVRPDIIVGDFRLSLSVSATLAKVPLLTLINAYWSPYAEGGGFPLPDHPLVKLVGLERAARHLDRALPRAFAHFAAPLEQVRRKFRLPPLGDLQHQLCYGDYTLHPDVPELVPTRAAPANHVYLGPVPWSPNVQLPEWWQGLDPALPTVYVTLGSSGAAHVLPTVFEVLSALPVNVLFARAGRTGESFSALAATRTGRVFIADYLPGAEAARRSAFVISNGGASTSYQALGEGVPVLGIPYNLDQYLAMTAIERAGAGVLLRAGNLAAKPLQDACLRLLGSNEVSRGAKAVQRAFSEYDCHARFNALLSRVGSKG